MPSVLQVGEVTLAREHIAPRQLLFQRVLGVGVQHFLLDLRTAQETGLGIQDSGFGLRARGSGSGSGSGYGLRAWARARAQDLGPLWLGFGLGLGLGVSGLG